MSKNLRINIERLSKRIQDLANIGAIRGGGVSRLALTDDDREGRNLVVDWMKELGLTITVDGIGNVVGVRKGKLDKPPVMMGSHIDTVTVGGPYDGCLGVLGGLEVIETLNENNIETDYPLAVAFFTNEEGSRFQPDMMGSLVYVGDMSLEEALSTFGINKASVRDSLTRIGYAGEAPCGQPNASAYFELHIEQGPALERAKCTIGAVELVQGISWTEVSIKGKSSHASYYPMEIRNDSGYVAGCIIKYVREIATKIGGYQVATVGRVEFHPNLVNVYADSVVMTVDMRNPDDDELKKAEKMLQDYLEKITKEQGVSYTTRKLARFYPTPFDKKQVDLVESTAKELGYPTMRLYSTAGHDAQILSTVCPSAMIFVPCVDGISHNIGEFTHESDIDAGANTLLHVVLKTSQASYLS